MKPGDASAGPGTTSTSGAVQVSDLTVDQWRETVRQLLDSRHVFQSLHVTRSPQGPEIRAAFARGTEFQMLCCKPKRAAVPTISDLVPAAAWDEREVAEQANLSFEGHETRPLTVHPEKLGDWVTPVSGHDVHHVAVGPVHAGIIESGHFRFHVVGERILHLDLRLFYKHRGLERAAEGKPLGQAIAVAQRACAACAVTNSVAFAQACEAALGLAPSPEISMTRTLLLELERLYNHLNDIAAACAGIGFAMGNMSFASLKEQAHRINHELTGHRFLFDTIQLGESELVIPGSAASAVRGQLESMRTETQRAWHEMLFNGSVQNRFDGIGVLTPETATALGAVGPIARASGLSHDQRTFSPRLAYDAFQPASTPNPSGDVRARIELRMLELETTFDLLDMLLAAGTATSRCEQGSTESTTGMSAVESPRGRTFCTIERTGSTLTRMRLRTASYANWPSLAAATADNLLPEFPLINKSFELCYACCDR